MISFFRLIDFAPGVNRLRFAFLRILWLKIKHLRQLNMYEGHFLNSCNTVVSLKQIGLAYIFYRTFVVNGLV